MSVKRSKKPRLLIDENMFPDDFSGLKKYAKIVSVVELVGRSGADDEEVYTMSANKDYHIVTQNLKHFTSIQKSKPQFRQGVIGIAADTKSESIKKFEEYVKNNRPSHEDFYKKCYKCSSKEITETKLSSSCTGDDEKDH